MRILALVAQTLFQTDRLVVRRLTRDDAPAMFEVYGDPEAMRWVDDGEPIERDECDRWIEVTLGNYESRGYGMSMIRCVEPDELVGFCGLVHPGGQEEPELKYSLLRRHWGHGFATEAARGLLDYASEQFAIGEVIATTYPENTASHRVLEKCGFAFSEDREEDDGSITRVFVRPSGVRRSRGTDRFEG